MRNLRFRPFKPQGHRAGKGQKEGLNPAIWFQRQISRHKETERSQERLHRGGAGAASSFSGTKVMGEGVQAGGKRWQDEELGLCRGSGMEGGVGLEGEGGEGGAGQMVGHLMSQAQGLGGPVKDEKDRIMARRECNLCRCSKGKVLGWPKSSFGFFHTIFQKPQVGRRNLCSIHIIKELLKKSI